MKVEIEKPDVLGVDEPRVLALTVKDAATGETLVESTLVRNLGSQQGLARQIHRLTGRDTLYYRKGDQVMPIVSLQAVRLLKLQHHDVLYCSGPVVHNVRCNRCRRAPIQGTRHHVKGFAIDLCDKCARRATKPIKNLLQPFQFPTLVLDGIWHVKTGQTQYYSVREWLKSVDGPYNTDEEIDAELAEGAEAVKGHDCVAWRWPKNAQHKRNQPLWFIQTTSTR